MGDVLTFLSLFVAPPLVYVFFRRSREVVHERFDAAARACGGRVIEGAWYLYPSLVVEQDGGELQMACRRGTSNGRPGSTFTHIGCDAYPARAFELKRMPRRVGLLERQGWNRTSTHDAAFDEVFWVQGEGSALVGASFDEVLRAKLLSFDEDLGVRVSLGERTALRAGRRQVDSNQWRLQVSIRRLPASVEEMRQLFEVTVRAHELLLRAPLRRSA